MRVTFLAPTFRLPPFQLNHVEGSVALMEDLETNYFSM